MSSYSEEEKILNTHFVDFDELISSSDVISFHVPLNKYTKYLIKKEHFQKMKPNTIIINTSHGGIIKESDLVWALENNVINGVGLDVLEEEPPSLENPIFKFSKVVITCHVGEVVIDNVYNMAHHIFNNIEKVAQGKALSERDIVLLPKRME